MRRAVLISVLVAAGVISSCDDDGDDNGPTLPTLVTVPNQNTASNTLPVTETSLIAPESGTVTG